MMAFAAAALAMASAEENGYPWSEMSGDWFILNRNQVYVPDSPSIYYHCVGGAGSVETRLVISSPGVAYDEIDFDTSTWEDPLDDWNATLNENIGQTTGLGGISVAGGSGCSCTYFQLNFYEWLKSNEDAGSAIAFDFYQRPWPAPTPSNWQNTGYLDPAGQDVGEILKVYGGDVTLSFELAKYGLPRPRRSRRGGNSESVWWRCDALLRVGKIRATSTPPVKTWGKF